jgi:FkbM family methyltransferase
MNLLLMILKWKEIRRRLIFNIKYNYFSELEIRIPISDKLTAPIPFQDSYDSFSEIFFRSEYDEIFEGIPSPNTWIDMGCHMGYFSLWIENRRQKEKKGLSVSKVLLIDGDKRTEAGIKQLKNCNPILREWKYIHGAISSPIDSVLFEQKDYMSSSISKENTTGKNTYKVPVISQEDILGEKTGTFDLVKVDIEGAEWELLEHYQSTLKNTKYLLMEWHSWHSGGKGKNQILEALTNLSFKLIKEIGPHGDASTFSDVGLILAKRQ